MFVDYFKIADQIPAKFIAPEWAKGFHCLKSSCGVCCITDPPPETPKAYLPILEKSICGFYVTKTRLCRRYDDRPLGCRLYPFIIGSEKGHLSFSACLACPSTNLQTNEVKESVQQMFSNKSMMTYVRTIASLYNSAASKPAIWMNAIDCWIALGSAVKSCMAGEASFPLMPRIREAAIEAIAHSLRTEKLQVAPFSFHDVLTQLSGSYIATRFESHSLCAIKKKGQKTHIALLDGDLHVLRRTKIKTPLLPASLEIDDRAKRLLRDYVEFLCNRPFISLSAYTSLAVNNDPVPFNILAMFVGSFAVFDAGATLIAMRDNLERVDADTMREIISLSEVALCSVFLSPKAALHH